MAHVISDECLSCGSCAGECPVGAISAGDVYVIDPESCTECGTCADVCPTESITLEIYGHATWENRTAFSSEKRFSYLKNDGQRKNIPQGARPRTADRRRGDAAVRHRPDRRVDVTRMGTAPKAGSGRRGNVANRPQCQHHERLHFGL